MCSSDLASHLARGKAAVAAHVELVPALEKSSKQSIQAPKKAPKEERYYEEAELVEVLENE